MQWGNWPTWWLDNDYVGKLCSSGRWCGKEAKGAHQVLDKYLNFLRLK